MGKECTTPYKEACIQKKSSILGSECWDYFCGGLLCFFYDVVNSGIDFFSQALCCGAEVVCGGVDFVFRLLSGQTEKYLSSVAPLCAPAQFPCQIISLELVAFHRAVVMTVFQLSLW